MLLNGGLTHFKRCPPQSRASSRPINTMSQVATEGFPHFITGQSEGALQGLLNFLDYFTLIKSLPTKWKEIIKNQTQSGTQSKDTDTLLTKLCKAEKAQRPSQVI